MRVEHKFLMVDVDGQARLVFELAKIRFGFVILTIGTSLSAGRESHEL
ncbi:Hypothetical protein I595_1918 [Croceitalea dokdonensis DOKDO 023]|uniref:Uncharacterized protein n=1 Tax=Croceitalea dokdonensis DOKDO 023 TaxID=1300341 RepID=A0A0N8H435_9FLAO|nr:hypothetical protein [Croceitalea dokdonensis]KPM32268.1 Hypothetical protein I595_1918 [Croceitalea dokdonensis DOKDO 023]